tara:strand:- start:559 stop:759 length:201 start_codon:yes stop_codon:yes gene_type:complete
MKMKKYRVIALMTTELELFVEAENKHEAVDIAYETDGGQFQEIPYSGDWNIEMVKEVEMEASNDKV